MNQYHLTQIILNLTPVTVPQLSRQVRYGVDIYYKTSAGEVQHIIVYLPIKESVYLWSWYDAITCHPRTNSNLLGLVKASKLACLLLQRTDILFTSTSQAYQFYKRHFDPAKLRLLLGNDSDEISLKLEKDANYHILGGYLGGESESKDKARFRSELTKQINLPDLVDTLIPSQCKNAQNKRLLNRFWQPLDCLIVN